MLNLFHPGAFGRDAKDLKGKRLVTNAVAAMMCLI